MTDSADNLARTFAVVTPELRVERVAVTPDLYERLDRDYDAFRGHVLVSQYSFTDDWPTWERHPAGDEIVVLLSGRVDLLLKRAAGEERVRLDVAGSYVVVPQNTWHTARVSEPATLLFITPGEGTENRS